MSSDDLPEKPLSMLGLGREPETLVGFKRKKTRQLAALLAAPASSDARCFARCRDAAMRAVRSLRSLHEQSGETPEGQIRRS